MVVVVVFSTWRTVWGSLLHASCVVCLVAVAIDAAAMLYMVGNSLGAQVGEGRGG